MAMVTGAAWRPPAGAAKAAADRITQADGTRVVQAPRSGDDAIVAVVRELSGDCVVVTADRAYYDSVQAAGGPDAGVISFPAYCPERRFRLSGAEVRVGRRSVSRGIDPEIDLTGPPMDTGVSRLHAKLIAGPGRNDWSVVDLSSNGIQVNGKDVPSGGTVPLRHGDRIHLGAWTVITITRD